MVSNFIGQNKRQAVLPIIYKTAMLCWWITLIAAVPVLSFPETFLYPIFGTEDMSVINDAKYIFFMLMIVLTSFVFGGVYFNGLTGTGATYFGLKIQIIGVAAYLVYINMVINVFNGGLFWAWGAEIVYWGVIWAITYWYIRSKKWYSLRF